MYAQKADSLNIAQKDTLPFQKKDSLGTQQIVLEDTTTEQKSQLSWIVNWDARNSFIKDKPVNIWGINAGIVYGKKRHQITFGYYWLTYNSYLRLVDFSKNAASLVNLDYYTKSDLFFVNIMYWKNFIKNKRWQFSMPLEVGMGATNSSGATLKEDVFLWERASFFLPFQTGLYLEWRATRWVGLSIMGGYRYALYQKIAIDHYNGWYYSFGISLQSAAFTDLYNLIFKPKKSTSKKAKTNSTM